MSRWAEVGLDDQGKEEFGAELDSAVLGTIFLLNSSTATKADDLGEAIIGRVQDIRQSRVKVKVTFNKRDDHCH
jgi:hypothetical protein